MISTPVHSKIETIPMPIVDTPRVVDKRSGKPGLPKEMAERVVEVIRKEYVRLDENKAALGRLLKRSPQALVQIMDGSSAPSMETANHVAQRLGLDLKELLFGPVANSDARQRIAELESQVSVLTRSLSRLENENATLRAAVAPRLSPQMEDSLKRVGEDDLAKRKAMRDRSDLADGPTQSGASEGESSAHGVPSGSGREARKQDSTRKRRS